MLLIAFLFARENIRLGINYDRSFSIMYLPVISPINELCDQALERGLAGDIQGARSCIDRVRTMRARLARVVASHKSDSLDDWIESAALEASEVTTYRAQTAALNKKLEIIRDWLSDSYTAFSTAELMASEKGVALYIDQALPEVWDFSQDVVVLCGDAVDKLYADLLLRAQKKFVVLAEPAAHGVLASESASDSDPKTIFFPPGSSPDPDIFTPMLGQDIPVIAMLNLESSHDHVDDFHRIHKSMSAALLGQRSVKEWPVIFTEQWLSRLHELVSLSTASDLRPKFEGSDVLLASPGPSLYDSLDALKLHRDKFLLVAPIRSLLTLLEAEIVPDFAFHVDATDFSGIIPKHADMSKVALICTDYAHQSVFQGGFSSIFTVPDPSMLGNGLTVALHGVTPPKLQGGCVSTCAVGFAAQLGAKSITLVGQDLSISRGNYVKQANDGPKMACQSNDEESLDEFLTCEGINGERLRTQEDYLWFIGEMENAAKLFGSNLAFINSTAHGARLDGWNHCLLNDHPLALGDAQDSRNRGDVPSLSDVDTNGRVEKLRRAIADEEEAMKTAAYLCEELVDLLHRMIKVGENNVTELETLEQRLAAFLTKKGSVLHFYTSRFSMALAAASKSVQSLEENLSISAEYYHQLGPRAKKLGNMLSNAYSMLDK